jgi:hypothetical protein
VHATYAGLPMASTTWAQLKLGPLLRGERDSRLYRKTFLPEPWATAGPLETRLRSYRRIPEPAVLGSAAKVDALRAVQVFTGLSDFFYRLAPHRELVRERLESITPTPVARETMRVVAHVRRGDFPVDLQTSDDWFIAMAEVVRSAGYSQPIVMVSDAPRSELWRLTEAGFELRRTGGALADLWTVAGASVVLASGASTFGSWATYLGDSLTLAPDHLHFADLDRQLPERVIMTFPTPSNLLIDRVAARLATDGSQ